MLRFETRKFCLFSALVTLLACGDDTLPAEPLLDGASATALDGGAAQDAARGGHVMDGGHVTDGGVRSAGDAGFEQTGGDDAGGDLGNPSGVGASACKVTGASAICTSKSVVMIGAARDQRAVYWALPARSVPAAGYPVVIVYQGTGFGPEKTWNTEVPSSFAFGGYYQIALIAELLESGYAVIQPQASGGTFWTTNTGGNYDTSLDGVFIPQLLSALHDGTFGKLDESKLYATGISSGGYMTSRMAVSYPGRFRALAIESGSYATCAGPFCSVPAQLPTDHPPTLLLHGGADTTVPISTAQDYQAKLMSNGIETKFVEDPSAGHQWLSVAPDQVRSWFDAH